MEEQAIHGRPSVLARHPETIPIIVTVVAWSALVALSPPGSWLTSAAGLAPTGGHAGHGGVFTTSGLVMVTGMTIAMMAPLAIPGARAVSRAWIPASRAMAFFVVAFLLTWTVIALCLEPVASTFAGILGTATGAAGLLTALCALAQFVPRGSAGRCDPALLLPGNACDGAVDAARFGVRSAGRGFGDCALPMLAMLAMPGSLLFMALLTALVVTDRMTGGRHRVVIAVFYAATGIGLLMIGLRI